MIPLDQVSQLTEDESAVDAARALEVLRPQRQRVAA